jgi:hypothetical protein
MPSAGIPLRPSLVRSIHARIAPARIYARGHIWARAFVLLDAEAVGIHKAEIELQTGLPVIGGNLKRQRAVVEYTQALACDG